MKKLIEKVIFKSKYVLNVFLLGLIVALGIYAYVYLKDLFHIIYEINTLSRSSALLHILELVDTVMVSTLLILVITGSYDTFIDRKHGFDHENISSGQLKTKLAGALLGISSINLFQSFNSASGVVWDTLYKQLTIHGVFLVGLMILAITEHIHVKDKKIHHDMKHGDGERSLS